MTIYLLKDYPEYAATSLADAQALFSALQDPSDADNAATIDRVQGKLAPLIQSDTGEPLVISSIDDTAGTISTWVTDPATSLALAIGDPDPNATLTFASLATFTISGSTRRGTLALNTTQLAAAVSGSYGFPQRGARRPFTLHLRKTTDGVTETVAYLQLRILPGVMPTTPTDWAGRTYYTAEESDDRYLQRNPGQGAYRFQNDGTGGSVFQLLNQTTGAFHTLFVVGAAGAEQFAIGPADTSPHAEPTGTAAAYRMIAAADGTMQFQLLNLTTGLFHAIYLTGASGAEQLAIGPAGT